MAVDDVDFANAQTQTLPVVTAGSRDELGWREVRVSRELVVDDDNALPVGRTRLVLVFGLVAVAALATVLALTRESGLPAESVAELDAGAGGSVFGDGPSFGSTPQRAPIDMPPPPRPSAGPTAAPAGTAPDRDDGSALPGSQAPRRQLPAGGRVGETGVARPGGSAALGNRAVAPPVRSVPAPRPPQVEHAVIEAEAAVNVLGGSAQRVRRPGLFNGGAVVGLGRAVVGRGEGWLRFNGVRAARPGQYAVTVYYVTPEGFTGRGVAATVRVGGRAPVALGTFPPAAQVRSRIIWVTLRQGVNTLWFGNAAGPAPVIDRILVRPNG